MHAHWSGFDHATPRVRYLPRSVSEHGTDMPAGVMVSWDHLTISVNLDDARELVRELTAVLAEADERQPREHAVLCGTCGRLTWEPSGRCAHHER